MPSARQAFVPTPLMNTAPAVLREYVEGDDPVHGRPFMAEVFDQLTRPVPSDEQRGEELRILTEHAETQQRLDEGVDRSLAGEDGLLERGERECLSGQLRGDLRLARLGGLRLHELVAEDARLRADRLLAEAERHGARLKVVECGELAPDRELHVPLAARQLL